MKKLTLFFILSIGCMLDCYAQTDAPSVKKDPVVDQYIGVQMNQLIRQVFNFNNSTSTANVSPYLLTYNINSKKTGLGIRAGIGYNYLSTSSDDGITATTSKLNDLQVRVGVDRAFRLSDRWSAGAGIDFIYNNNNDNTSSTINSSDTVTTVTKTASSSYGGGPMGWLRFHVTEHVLIGTEASFYYVTGKQTVTTDVTDAPFGGGGFGGTTTTETVSKPTISQGTFSLPVAFYLIVRF